jgi:hypothetical protein
VTCRRLTLSIVSAVLTLVPGCSAAVGHRPVSTAGRQGAEERRHGRLRLVLRQDADLKKVSELHPGRLIILIREADQSAPLGRTDGNQLGVPRMHLSNGALNELPRSQQLFSRPSSLPRTLVADQRVNDVGGGLHQLSQRGLTAQRAGVNGGAQGCGVEGGGTGRGEKKGVSLEGGAEVWRE